jgi:anaerobic selenocysteine-containing dehydrogenase
MLSERQQKLSFCRLCMGHCGVVATVDGEGRLVEIRGDHDDPQTLGYACYKGLNAAEAHNSPERILHPLKRRPDGSFERLPLEQALDEIADRLQVILDRDGPEAVAGYKGGGAFFTSSSVLSLNAFLRAVGSPKAFSSVTIDQSAKSVAAGRIGIWPPGRVPFHRGDVFMIVGGNPLVSISTGGFDTRNPQKRLRQAKARGMKLIVIDPRRTETARSADVFLQPLPGEDASILAGLVHIILEHGWQDREFCERYADDVDALRRAVARFTPGYVAQRADVPEDRLHEAARVFAHECSRGAATSATGPDMSPHCNLTEHLLECLNVICGRFLREGEPIDNPGVLAPRVARRAEVVPAPRWWEQGYRSRVGEYGLLDGELPTGTLPDEILTPGPGQVKALLVHGGNPVSAIPDQRKVVRAFESLELLVSIEPFMSVTAELSHYILPPTLQYERADLPLWVFESLLSPEPYTRYTAPVSTPPAGSEVRDDHYYFWALAHRLGVSLKHLGQPLDTDTPPETDALLAMTARKAPLPFEQIVASERGVYVDVEPQYVEPGDPDSPHRFSLLPRDIAAELDDVFDEWSASREAIGGRPFRYRLAVRRLRDALNSAGLNLPAIKKRVPYNLAYLNPEDLAHEGLADGDHVMLESAFGSIRVMTAADASVRRGVVSIAHGFGGLPDRGAKYEDRGASTNLLLSLGDDREPINAMPRMSGIPVNVRRAPPV